MLPKLYRMLSSARPEKSHVPLRTMRSRRDCNFTGLPVFGDWGATDYESYGRNFFWQRRSCTLILHGWVGLAFSTVEELRRMSTDKGALENVFLSLVDAEERAREMRK